MSNTNFVTGKNAARSYAEIPPVPQMTLQPEQPYDPFLHHPNYVASFNQQTFSPPLGLQQGVLNPTTGTMDFTQNLSPTFGGGLCGMNVGNPMGTVFGSPVGSPILLPQGAFQLLSPPMSPTLTMDGFTAVPICPPMMSQFNNSGHMFTMETPSSEQLIYEEDPFTGQKYVKSVGSRMSSFDLQDMGRRSVNQNNQQQRQDASIAASAAQATSSPQNNQQNGNNNNPSSLIKYNLHAEEYVPQGSYNVMDTMNSISQRKSKNDMYIVSAAMDRRQSLALQKEIAQSKASGNIERLESMFYQFLPEIIRLSRDQCANFVLQRLIETLSTELVDTIVNKIRKDVIVMATNQYACRVLQSILTLCSEEKKVMLLHDLMPDAEELLQNNFGCYVLQKLIETVDSEKFEDFMEENILPRFFDLSVQQYSCRVMQDIFRYFKSPHKAVLTERVCGCCLDLSRDEYGNYVVQKLIHYGNKEARTKTIDILIPHVMELSTNKAGSNILEKCFSKASEQQKEALMRPLIDKTSLTQVIQHRYGNYVIQRMLITLPYKQKNELVGALTAYFDNIGADNLNEYDQFVFQQISPK